MQYTMPNRATFRVEDTMDVSGRLTADSINDGACTKTKSSLLRACRLMIFSAVVAVGGLASLAPVPALAAEGGLPEEIAALKKEIAELQSQAQSLQNQITTQQEQITSLQTALATVQSNKALALGPFVTVDPNPERGVIGPNIVFSGANIHIVSGSGATTDNFFSGGSLTGLGNLIIGYDEVLSPGGVGPDDRGGSHNLVIGMNHRFTNRAFGGLVAGESNQINAEGASVSGGNFNTAGGSFTSVSGGQQNNAFGVSSSVSSGLVNTANASFASVTGGLGNRANATGSTVLGGSDNAANTLFSIRPQPPFNP
jgi:hypothetical protein